MSKKKNKSKAKFKLIHWLGLTGLIFLSSFITIILAYHLALAGKIYRYVSIAGIDVSALTPLQAHQLLAQKTNQLKLGYIELQQQNNHWQIDLDSIDFSFDLNQSVETAFALGRRESFWQNQQTKIKLLKNGRDLPLTINLAEDKLRQKLATISALIETPLVEPTIQLVTKASQMEVQIDPGSDGQKLDLEQTIKQIKEQLSWLNFAPIILPIQTLSSTVNPVQLEQTQKRARSLIGKSLRLKSASFARKISGQELIDLLSFQNGFDTNKINALVDNLKQGIDRPPQNAAFQFAHNRVVLFRPDRDGKELQTNTASLLIQQQLSLLEATSSAELIANLPVRTIPAAITTAAVNNLGIQQRLGTGISFFRGSIANRVHNIQLAAHRLNGILIAPNETFSFNAALGEVSKNTGFKEAYIISRGRTILGDGGGVCQVSTTLFRAALNAGLPIVERWPHSYRVAYYEQNAGPGLDATVFEPNIDLKFKNDTPAHILIQATVNTHSQQLTFELYGSPDGRRAQISQPRIWDQVPPPPPLYQDDPTLPAGVTKQVDWAAWGAKTSFNYKVIKNDKVSFEKTFYSHFQPWQAVYLRGIGSL